MNPTRPSPVHPLRATVFAPRLVAYLVCAALVAVEIGVEARSLGAIVWLAVGPWLYRLPVAPRWHRPLRRLEELLTLGLPLLAGLPGLPVAAFGCVLLAGTLNVHGPRAALESAAVLAALAIAVLAADHPLESSPGAALLAGVLLASFALLAAGMSHLKTVRLDRAGAALAERAAVHAALAERLARYLPPAVHRAAFDGVVCDRVAVDRVAYDRVACDGVAGDRSDRDGLVDAGAGVATPAAAVEGPRRAWLTVCFADLAGFTALTDASEGEEVVALLDDFYTAMAESALAYGGTLDKFIGDAVMVFFGAPTSSGRGIDARACVAMADDMQRRFEALRAGWRARGITGELALRAGIHSGWCTVGDFGHGERRAWTVIGSTVNTASRIETAARPGEVLLSRGTWLLLGDDGRRCRRRGALHAKGLAHPVDLFRRVAAPGEPRRLTGDGIDLRLDLGAADLDDARRLLDTARRLVDDATLGGGRSAEAPASVAGGSAEASERAPEPAPSPEAVPATRPPSLGRAVRAVAGGRSRG